jgi:hypothetical protein
MLNKLALFTKTFNFSAKKLCSQVPTVAGAGSGAGAKTL